MRALSGGRGRETDVRLEADCTSVTSIYTLEKNVVLLVLCTTNSRDPSLRDGVVREKNKLKRVLLCGGLGTGGGECS